MVYLYDIQSTLYGEYDVSDKNTICPMVDHFDQVRTTGLDFFEHSCTIQSNRFNSPARIAYLSRGKHTVVNSRPLVLQIYRKRVYWMSSGNKKQN